MVCWCLIWRGVCQPKITIDGFYGLLLFDVSPFSPGMNLLLTSNCYFLIWLGVCQPKSPTALPKSDSLDACRSKRTPQALNKPLARRLSIQMFHAPPANTTQQTSQNGLGPVWPKVKNARKKILKIMYSWRWYFSDLGKKITSHILTPQQTHPLDACQPKSPTALRHYHMARRLSTQINSYKHMFHIHSTQADSYHPQHC